MATIFLLINKRNNVVWEDYEEQMCLVVSFNGKNTRNFKRQHGINMFQTKQAMATNDGNID